MIAYALPAGGGHARLTMGYDADGMHAWKENSSAARTYLLYDGSDLIAELTSAGALSTYQTGGADGVVSRRAGATSLFYAFDPEGSAAAVLNASAAVQGDELTEANGRHDGSYASSPVAFGGQWGYYTDAETGLSVLGHRYYDSGAGRFLTRDPIRYNGGVNLYGYTANDYENRKDPRGLDASSDFYDAANVAFGEQWAHVQQVAQGWNNAIGALGDWIAGTGPSDRVYSQYSTQSQQMQESYGGKQVQEQLTNQLRAGINPSKIRGNVSTPGAAWNTIRQPWNGTQAQVGGFIWNCAGEGPNGSYKIRIYNRMSFDSFYYHGLYIVPLPEYNRFSWGFGPEGNIHQDFYYYEWPSK